MPKIKKLDMREVSGVDYPAHLANGFSITKSTNPEKTAAFFRAAGKEIAMTTKEVTAKSLAEATPEEIAEVAKGLTPEQLQPIIDAVNSVVEDANDGGSDDDQEDAAGNIAASADVELYDKDGNRVDATGKPIDPKSNLLKGLGSDAVALVKSLQAQVEEAREVAKAASERVNIEKAMRLDQEAIAVSKSAYPHLGFDHTTVAPAIRKFKETDPQTAGVIEGLMKALNGQAESAALFKELGTAGGGQETDAYGKIEARATELLKAGTVTNKAAAISKALEESPELYSEYQKENR